MSVLSSVSPGVVPPYMDRLKHLFQDMEDAYSQVANQYGFQCSGCSDSCCLTLFYHHTLLEFLYLKQGLETLSSKKKEEVITKAKNSTIEIEQQTSEKLPVRAMCPLNQNGSCITYSYRPMICRLHGIAHELTRPGHPTTYSPGCTLFTTQTEKMDYIPFDRTPYYIRLAHLEKELREASGYGIKIKKTIAEIILS